MAKGKLLPSSQKNIIEGVEQRTIPVHKETRDRVKRLKGSKSYEEIISEWADRYGKGGDPDCH